jgi:chaperonin GroES
MRRRQSPRAETAAAPTTFEEWEVMNIRPLQDRVIVERMDATEKSAGGLYIPDTAKEKPQEGKVTAVGKGKRRDDGTVIPMDVKAGDRILFAKFAGNDVTVNGKEYFIMREEDILGVL